MTGKHTSFYEIPPEMMQMAEKNVAQAKQAFDSFVGAARQAVRQAESQFDTAVTGAKDVRNTAMQLAEQNITNAFEFARKLMAARDVQEVVALQTEFVKRQMDALASQARDIGQKATKMTGGKAG